MILFNKKKKHY